MNKKLFCTTFLGYYIASDIFITTILWSNNTKPVSWYCTWKQKGPILLPKF